MKNGIFTDRQKNDLAGFKMLYQHNSNLASGVQQYSLQAAEALWSLSDLFLAVTDSVKTEKDLQDIIRRFKEATNAKVDIKGVSLAERTNEFVTIITALKIKSRSKVRRLRSNL